MIGRANRFHGYNSLRYVYRHGKTVREPHMSLRYCDNNKREDYRLAVVVSKKVNKSAVARNRIRRRIYEAFRAHMALGQPLDLVITVFQANVETIADQELQAEIASLLQQAGLKTRDIIESKES
ncbi:MAG: ribonuclease P protein component [Candidatus Saccharibacteria bacterium]